MSARHESTCSTASGSIVCCVHCSLRYRADGHTDSTLLNAD